MQGALWRSREAAKSGELGTPREKRDEMCLVGADVLQLQVGRLRPGRAECFAPSPRDGVLETGEGTTAGMEMEQETGMGTGLGVKMWMNWKHAGLVTCCLGARLDWAGLAGVGLGCLVCKRSSPIQAPGTGGEDFCQQVRQPAEGLGLWGKAGSEEEEEEPKEGRSGGQDILWELGGWGLGDASEVSQGPGTGAAERELEGAGCWSQFAEGIVGARKGKDVGAGFGEMLQPGLRMLV